MRNGKARLQTAPHFCRQQMQRNSGGVGGEDDLIAQNLFQAGIEPLLDLQVLNDDLDNPVAVCKHTEVIVQVSGHDLLGIALMHERRRRLLQRLLHHPVGNICAFRSFHIEQDNIQTRIGAMGSNAHAHDA